MTSFHHAFAVARHSDHACSKCFVFTPLDLHNLGSKLLVRLDLIGQRNLFRSIFSNALVQWQVLGVLRFLRIGPRSTVFLLASSGSAYIMAAPFSGPPSRAFRAVEFNLLTAFHILWKIEQRLHELHFTWTWQLWFPTKFLLRPVCAGVVSAIAPAEPSRDTSS